MDAHQIKKLLADRAEDVCALLLPRGRKHGHYWHAGSLDGEPGDSLRVCLSGAKAGVWMEGNGRDSGGVLDLWMGAKRLKFLDALEEARSWLGVAKMPPRESRKSYTKPDASMLKKPASTSPVLDYLINERCLKKGIIESFGVSQKSAGTIAFPYYEPDGVLAFIKFIDVARNERDKKIVSVTPGAKPVLFGMNTKLVAESNGVLGICEGEIDAMSWQCEGLPFCSVPMGAKSAKDDGSSSNDEWIENCWDFLERFHTIYISMDGDEEGQKAAIAIAHRLGLERCRLVSLPEKDGNACRQKGISLKPFLDSARFIEPDDVSAADALGDEVWSQIQKGPESKCGLPLFGWTDYAFRIRPREGTIWTGYTSHGKTTFLRQLIAFYAANGERIFVGSYEDSPARFLSKMTRQIMGHFPDIDNKSEFTQLTERVLCNVIMHKIDGVASWQRFFEQAEYAQRRYGCTQAVMDNLTSTNVNIDDNESMTEFAKASQAFWKKTAMHLHVVAHPKKPHDDGRLKVPRVESIKGAGALADLFWNVVAIFRADDNQPSIHIHKQRETGDHGEPMSRKMRFDKTSERFRLDCHQIDRRPYIEFHQSTESSSEQQSDIPE